MEFLNEYMMPVVLGICLVVGYIIKKWVDDVDNKYIPSRCAHYSNYIANSFLVLHKKLYLVSGNPNYMQNIGEYSCSKTN